MVHNEVTQRRFGEQEGAQKQAAVAKKLMDCVKPEGDVQSAAAHTTVALYGQSITGVL